MLVLHTSGVCWLPRTQSLLAWGPISNAGMKRKSWWPALHRMTGSSVGLSFQSQHTGSSGGPALPLPSETPHSSGKWCSSLMGPIFFPCRWQSRLWPQILKQTFVPQILFQVPLSWSSQEAASDSVSLSPVSVCACTLRRSASVMSDFAIPWTGAWQAPLSTKYSRQENWSGLQFPSLGDLPDPGIKTPVSCIGRVILHHWATWEALPISRLLLIRIYPDSRKPIFPCIHKPSFSPFTYNLLYYFSFIVHSLFFNKYYLSICSMPSTEHTANGVTNKENR